MPMLGQLNWDTSIQIQKLLIYLFQMNLHYLQGDIFKFHSMTKFPAFSNAFLAWSHRKSEQHKKSEQQQQVNKILRLSLSILR